MNAGGGAALAHSFLVTYGTRVTGENLKSILGHEMTHTWTSNDDLGQWYNEGGAVYYQALLAWRAGLITADQFLADLNQTASRYYTNALRATPEDQVLPHFWEDTRFGGVRLRQVEPLHVRGACNYCTPRPNSPGTAAGVSSRKRSSKVQSRWRAEHDAARRV
jgi:M61 glycyl aminopeptidase